MVTNLQQITHALTRSIVLLLATALVCWSGQPAVAGEQAVDFEADVLPILEDNCFYCHGKNKQRSGLRVDHLAGLLRGGGSGEPAVVPHRSAESYLIKAVTGKSGGKRMPLNADPLPNEEIELLRKWIDAGAKWPGQDPAKAEPDPFLKHDHWSLKPVKDPAIPGDAEDPWSSNAIDGFILHRLNKEGLKPSKQADRRVLIRRAFFTLHGLVPTPEQLDRYTKDPRDDWYPRMVDDLLESPRYGERWARHWLDLVRYAETNGFEMNRPRDNAYHYRDYVIRALNDDKSYDDFIVDQLAGDMTGEHAATGFLVAGPHDNVANQDPVAAAVARENELADMVNATSTALLGMTVACARCHNHKFDPILSTDYYAMAAVFTGVYHGEREMPKDKKQLALAQKQLGELNRQLDTHEPLAELDLQIKNHRAQVNAIRNVDRFKPVKARYLRFVIESTNNNSEPCIDELEVYPAANQDNAWTNIASATNGAVATSSGDYAGNAFHKLEHINDNRFGNARSWISDKRGEGWVQISLPQAYVIDRVIWGRDRTGGYGDRLPTGYRIEVATEPGKWTVVARSSDRARSPGDYKDIKRAEEIAALLAKRKTLMGELKGTRIYAGTFGKVPTTHRLYRGDPTQPREVVAPDTLTVLGELSMKPDEPEQQRRYKFAKSLVTPDHPLTARVMVNRIWQHHFGMGLVTTPSDFGRMGVPPTHPELLDYLASRFVENGWSMKSLHRLILNSSTFKQQSAPEPAALKVDSQSALLWRFPPRRYEAEAIRDNILLASGKLDLRMYGPGFKLFLPNTNYVRVYNHKRAFVAEDFRRMVYAHTVRMERDLTFGSFDCPDGGQPAPQRARSTTAIQAISLFNSPFVIEQAGFFAERLRKEAGEEVEAQVRRAYRLLYSREPSAEELEECVTYSSEHGLEQLCRVLFNTNEFLFVQ